jgi:RNA polymerase sigma factor (sigma-70 family)
MLGEMRPMGGAWGGTTSSASIGARWRTLVRAAVRLGCARHDAADVVQTALARCDVGWSKVSRADNRDAYVYRTLVNALRYSQRRHWWRERPARSLPDVTRPDDTTRVALADAVERALDELTAEQRAVVVLRYIRHRPNVRQPPHSASPSEPSRAGGRARARDRLVPVPVVRDVGR